MYQSAIQSPNFKKGRKKHIFYPNESFKFSYIFSIQMEWESSVRRLIHSSRELIMWTDNMRTEVFTRLRIRQLWGGRIFGSSHLIR